MTEDGLNDRQRKFAELLVNGMAAGRAYESAGYDCVGKIADQKASRLLATNGKVADYVAKLREEAKKTSLMTRESKLQMLAEIAAEQKQEDPRVAIAAIAEENKMTGGYEPERHQVEYEVIISVDAD